VTVPFEDEAAEGLPHPRAVYRPLGQHGASSTSAHPFQDPLPPQHDEPVFHYTSAEGMYGLLTSGCVFASHAVTMNDPREGSYGWDVIRNRYLAHPPPGAEAFQGVFDETFSGDSYRSWETPAFVLSGTALGGDLNQYRLYGMYQAELPGGTWSLQPIGDRRPSPVVPRAQWRPVLYGAAAAEPYVDLMLAWAVRIMQSVNPENFEDTGLVAALAIQVLALHIKDAAYAHEAELRLVFGVDRWFWRDWVEVRPRDRRLVPYVRAGAGNEREGVVRAVELGPTVQGQANRHAIQHLHRTVHPDSSLTSFTQWGLPVSESPTHYRDG